MIPLIRFNLYLLLGLLLAQPSGLKAAHQAVKEINKEFKIQPDGRLLVDNRYGDLDVAIGPAGKISIHVKITSDAQSENKARENIERVSIDFNEGLNRVEARTTLASGSSWGSWWGNNNAKIRIDYQVLVPADVFLELNNKYGGIFVESTGRDARIGIGYGEIRCGDINANLDLEMSYSKGNLSRIRNGKLKLSYSELDMEDMADLELDMKYTDASMGNANRVRLTSAYGDFKAQAVQDLQYTGKYDDLEIDEVGTLRAETGYAGIEIGALAREAAFDMKYGDIRIDRIHRGFAAIRINTSYTGVKLGFESGAAFTLDADNNYCDVDHADLQVSERIQKSGSLVLKGQRGTGGGQVVARMNYGELEIREP